MIQWQKEKIPTTSQLIWNYHAGTYKPGYELTVKEEIGQETAVGAVTNRILSDYRKIYGIDANKPPFAQVYDRFYAEKFPEGHKYSKATEGSTKAAFRNCSMVSLFHQLYKYTIVNDICEKDYNTGIK